MERDRNSDRHRRREHTDDPTRDDHFTIRDVLASYNAQAPTLVRTYEDLPFKQVHAPVLDLLPDPGAHILDMGAGSARDDHNRDTHLATYFDIKVHHVVQRPRFNRLHLALPGECAEVFSRPGACSPWQRILSGHR